MSVGSAMVRFLIEGTIVSVFAALGSCFKPKTFAGLFGSAPTIALASLAIAFHEHGTSHVEQLARSMIGGAVALIAYSACCVILVERKLPVALGAALSWACWGALSAVLFSGMLR